MSKPTWVRWRIVALLIVASFVSYNLRLNLSLAPEAMMTDLGLSEIQWGWVLAAFPVGYALFQLPGGVAADRHGPRRVLALIALAWGALIVVTSAVPGPALVPTAVTIGLLFAVQLMVGAAHAPVFPTVNCVIQRWFPVGHWALPNGLTSTGLTWGAAAITPVLVWLVAAFGWRSSFIIIAPLAFVTAGLWWWYARNYPSDHPGVNTAEAELINAHRGADPDQEVQAGYWRVVIRNRDLLLLTLAYSCMNYGYYTVFSWFYYYLSSISEAASGLAVTVTALQWIFGGIGAALGGALCDRLCRRMGFRWGCRGPVVLAMLASGALLLGGLASDNVHLAAAMFVGFFFFNQFTEGPFWAASMAIGRDLAGSAGGVMNTGANTMGAIMTVLAPVIAANFSWTVSMGTAAPFAFLAAILMMFVRADHPLVIKAPPPAASVALEGVD